MAKIKIYEVGRLTNNQLSSIKGGASCTRFSCGGSSGMYTVTECVSQYGVCTGGYLSCSGQSLGDELSCGRYCGPIGPAGILNSKNIIFYD